MMMAVMTMMMMKNASSSICNLSDSDTPNSATKIQLLYSLLQRLLPILPYLVYLRILRICSTTYCSETQFLGNSSFTLTLVFWSLWHQASQSALLLVITLLFYILCHSSSSKALKPNFCLHWCLELCHPHDSRAALFNLNFNNFHVHTF